MSAAAMKSARRDSSGAIVTTIDARNRYSEIERRPSAFSEPAKNAAWCARADAWADTWAPRP